MKKWNNENDVCMYVPEEKLKGKLQQGPHHHP